MFRNFVVALVFLLTSALSVSAQTKGTWIQIEAKQTQDEAMERIAVYAEIMPEVGGFELSNGWFAVAIGPFSTIESEFLITQFRRTGLIPPDSYISSPDQFVRQFYPAEATVIQTTPVADPPKTTLPDNEAEAVLKAGSQAEVYVPDETASEARASEAELTLDQKKELQVALQWAGFYNSTIDGLFGRGTRGSMSEWQKSKGFEETGILTTGQRSVLLGDYYAILNGLDMGPVTDDKAGITIEMPRAVVQFDGYTAPFAHYRSPEGNVAEVHLISRPGDRDTLYALYDVMEQLDIVPLEGPRRKNRNNFRLTGRNDSIISHTEAYLSGGEIKGFTLVWPADQEEQAERIIDRMIASFSTTGSVLSRGEGLGLEPGQDRLSGLGVRTPSKILSGAFINRDGYVLTSSEIGAECTIIEVQGDLPYEITASSADIGVSVLRPQETVVPHGFGELRNSENRAGTKVSVAGYSFGGVLSAPTLTHGKIAATTGLAGEEHLDRLTLSHFASDAGGAVLGTQGEITGVLSPRVEDPNRTLPQDVSFMTDSSAIVPFLSANRIAHTLSRSLITMDAVDIERKARDIAVWVSCWE